MLSSINPREIPVNATQKEHFAKMAPRLKGLAVPRPYRAKLLNYDAELLIVLNAVCVILMESGRPRRIESKSEYRDGESMGKQCVWRYK